jgi:hypothetical protein
VNLNVIIANWSHLWIYRIKQRVVALHVSRIVAAHHAGEEDELEELRWRNDEGNVCAVVDF